MGGRGRRGNPARDRLGEWETQALVVGGDCVSTYARGIQKITKSTICFYLCHVTCSNWHALGSAALCFPHHCPRNEVCKWLIHKV